MRSAVMQNISAQERAERAQYYVSAIYRDKYIAWTASDAKVKYTNGTLEISSSGGMNYPFAGVIYGEAGGYWEADCHYSERVINQAFIIRTYRKLQGGVDAAEEALAGNE